jgi:tRNA pseudouridine55 synthase
MTAFKIGSNDMILNLYKQTSETPLECMNRAREELSLPPGEPMTYAGRLDPMADGVLIALTGEDRFNRDAFLKLDKTYRVHFLFGIATDTQDALGLITSTSPAAPNEADLKRFFDNLPGKIQQTLPLYSSYKVKGKPLHWYAQQGLTVEPPTFEREVYSSDIKKVFTLASEQLLARLTEVIQSVGGEFRQTQILKRWQTADLPTHLTICEVEIAASSGTYMRALADSLTKELDIPCLALSITRLKAGDYSLESIPEPWFLEA